MNLKLFLYILAIVAFIVGAVLCAVDKTITDLNALECMFIGLALFVGGHIAPPTV